MCASVGYGGMGLLKHIVVVGAQIAVSGEKRGQRTDSYTYQQHPNANQEGCGPGKECVKRHIPAFSPACYGSQQPGGEDGGHYSLHTVGNYERLADKAGRKDVRWC